MPLQTCEFTIYVCTQSRACAHRHVDEHAHTHIHAHTHTHTHTQTHAYTRMQTTCVRGICLRYQIPFAMT
ncbi:MAG: hypothetical protein CME32_12680 [Gimesia sp.]|nr:hypothetical protein [Gimesia sp.]